MLHSNSRALHNDNWFGRSGSISNRKKISKKQDILQYYMELRWHPALLCRVITVWSWIQMSNKKVLVRQWLRRNEDSILESSIKTSKNEKIYAAIYTKENPSGTFIMSNGNKWGISYIVRLSSDHPRISQWHIRRHSNAWRVKSLCSWWKRIQVRPWCFGRECIQETWLNWLSIVCAIISIAGEEKAS